MVQDLDYDHTVMLIDACDRHILGKIYHFKGTDFLTKMLFRANERKHQYYPARLRLQYLR